MNRDEMISVASFISFEDEHEHEYVDEATDELI